MTTPTPELTPAQIAAETEWKTKQARSLQHVTELATQRMVEAEIAHRGPVEAPRSEAFPALSAFLAAATVADDAKKASRDAEARKLENGEVSEARALTTRHGQLKVEYLTRVAEATSIDFDKLIRGTPENLAFDADSRSMRSRTHEAIRRFQRVVPVAYQLLNSTFGDQGLPRDTSPMNLEAAAMLVKAAIDGGQTHDHLSGQLDMSFRRNQAALHFWIERGRNLVEGTTRLCKEFDETEKEMLAALAEVTPLETPTPAREKFGIPPDQPRPVQESASSYADWSPFDPPTRIPPDNIEVTPLVGGGAQVRRKGRR